MKLGKIKTLPNVQIQEDALVVMEELQSVIQIVKGLSRVNWELSNIQEIENTTYCPDKTNRGQTVCEVDIKDNAKEKMGYLIVFSARNIRQVADSFHEKAQIVIW